MKLPQKQESSNTVQRSLIMLTLVLAGEAIFLLPFVLVRIFRPTLLDVFGLTNLQIGVSFSVYGIVALIALLKNSFFLNI